METLIAAEIEQDVRYAAIAAFNKHGPLTIDPVRASIILTEEVGEVAADVLKMTRPSGTPQMEARLDLYNELAQVAQVAMVMMTNLKEEMNLGQRT